MPVDLIYSEITEKVISAYYEVYSKLGYGFLEKVYENAMRIALRKRGLDVMQQCPIQVVFDGEVVGEYFADLFVNNLVVFEIKAARELTKRTNHSFSTISLQRTLPLASYSISAQNPSLPGKP